MNDKFDELAKALAQPVARRAALKRFGVGAAAALLAAFGLAPRAEAGSRGDMASLLNDQSVQGGISVPVPARHM